MCIIIISRDDIVFVTLMNKLELIWLENTLHQHVNYFLDVKYIC